MLVSIPLFSQDCPPETPQKEVVDTYHGVAVKDSYQWLEDAASPEVKAWTESQNACVRKFLDALPGRKELMARVERLRGTSSPSYGELKLSGGKIFAIKSQPPKQQPLLVSLNSADDTSNERVILDPNVLDTGGKTAIDWYFPSEDGILVAVSLSSSGSECGDVHTYECATGKEVFEVVPRVNGGTAGGSLAWNADASGFYYTRYPRGSERAPEDMGFYQQVYFHKLGTPTEKDTYCIGKDFPRIAEIQLEASRDGKLVLAKVQKGDGGEYSFYLMGPSGTWSQVADFQDRATGASFGPGGDIYMLSLKGAPKGKILRVPISSPSISKARPIIPESDVVIEGFLPTEGRIYTEDNLGGISTMRIFNAEGKSQGSVPVPATSSVGQVVWLTADEILFRCQSYTEPPAWYSFKAGAKSVTKTALKKVSPADFSDTQVERVFAVSKDGTKVPLTLLYLKGTKFDGTAPALLTGYGGFNISMTPRFSESNRIFVEQGGIMAIASLRGGGEFGEEWHEAGRLLKKQNVFDDFLACAQFLVEKGYTKKDRLGITGGSNGGLLMGAAMVQRPDLFKAVVSHVGVYDMLRYELTPNGFFNTTEFGSVKDPEQFKALHAYSPFHNVKDGAAYPATLMLTGANDPRVDPAQSRKMVARSQASGAGGPILLRTSGSSGHGLDTALSERVAEDTDVYSFIFFELGVSYRPVK